MAKSLRSKWKRKMKAVKRVRYGEKVTKENLQEGWFYDDWGTGILVYCGSVTKSLWNHILMAWVCDHVILTPGK